MNKQEDCPDHFVCLLSWSLVTGVHSALARLFMRLPRAGLRHVSHPADARCVRDVVLTHYESIVSVILINNTMD